MWDDITSTAGTMLDGLLTPTGLLIALVAVAIIAGGLWALRRWTIHSDS